MAALGPLLPSTSLVRDTGYSWNNSVVCRSLFFNDFRLPGREFRNEDVFTSARVEGFSFFTGLSRYALVCICKMFRVPDLLLSGPLEHLISFSELLVRTYLSTRSTDPFIR